MTAAVAGEKGPPLIWVITGSKTGDNAQVLRGANAIGLGYQIKRIVLLPQFETAKPRIAASLDHIDREKSDLLHPPWPDLIITIGRRLSMVALWIRQQSGFKSRIALFNAPKGEAGEFDLVVLPAFYNMGDGAKVCRIGLPLIAIDPAQLNAAHAQYAGTIGASRRPLNVLLLGGDTGNRPLNPQFAASVIARMREGYAATGSIFASTSRRTPAAVTGAVERLLRPGDQIHRWSPAKDGNPYLGLLAHGDTFTVTSDSLSMLTEVARLGRPLIIAEPPEQAGWLNRIKAMAGTAAARDLQKAAAFLYQGGYAVRLGDVPGAPRSLPPDDTEKVGERLRQLALAGH